MKYSVALKHSEEGVAIWVPALPGCFSQGDTEAEALENIVDAIRMYLDSIEGDVDLSDEAAGIVRRVVEVAA